MKIRKRNQRSSTKQFTSELLRMLLCTSTTMFVVSYEVILDEKEEFLINITTQILINTQCE